MRCPTCHKHMEEGVLSVKEGLNWLRANDSPAGLAFAEGIPGTAAILRANRLAGWRCRGCETVVFTHGKRNESLQRERSSQVETTENEQ